MEHYEHLKEYISERENSIDREIDKKYDNPFLNAHYNGLKIEFSRFFCDKSVTIML